MLYPLFFEPEYKERVWGGTALQRRLNKKIPYNNTGESWEIACHNNGNSIVKNGDLKGKTLKEILKTNSRELLGYETNEDYVFPLLIKFIDANDKLSVQVHPEDEYAKTNENGELGKSEAWYILDAKPGAKLIAGLKDNVSRDDFKKALEGGYLEKVLNEIEVKKGDIINIPSGLVHAIEDGILLAEIQQNSDTTYRVYDWNRVGLNGKMRDLHIDKSLDVIDFEGKHNRDIVSGLNIIEGDGEINYYVANKYFSIEKINLQGTMEENTQNKFIIYMCIAGSGEVNHNNMKYSFAVGDTFMMPALIGKYKLEGNTSLLKTYIPDITKDIINKLQDAGYTEDEIIDNIRISK